ncbi:YigZ family protein [Paenibacillus oenotherae]|uniref:YigZ family protein n=1 Tax=Paenibacillus oenotherae TaxID=1435645 RepID=A0ABS7D9E0_9BACL|nr:YigZ family protein [Paenibacillus oenotherae]MBW7476564.1 YigZ family protein [Paenibacillus oenotherae]
MLNKFRTVRQQGDKEIIIKKSRFIGYGKPVESEAEAVAFIEEIKKLHWNATHNCSAYVVGERDECQKQSDDGEPSGTAGKPILEVIKNQGLKNVAIVVTRYFGGIMLGAGGLIRAYTDGAVAAIEAAEPVTYVLHREIIVDVDYTWYGKLENELHARGVKIGGVDFTDRVVITCLPEAPDAERFSAWMTDVTQGQAFITPGDTKYHIEGV